MRRGNNPEVFMISSWLIRIDSTKGKGLIIVFVALLTESGLGNFNLN